MPRIGFSMYHTPCCRPEFETLTLIESFHLGSSRSSYFWGVSGVAGLLGLEAGPAMMMEPQVKKPSGVLLYSGLKAAICGERYCRKPPRRWKSRIMPMSEIWMTSTRYDLACRSDSTLA